MSSSILLPLKSWPVPTSLSSTSSSSCENRPARSIIMPPAPLTRIGGGIAAPPLECEGSIGFSRRHVSSSMDDLIGSDAVLFSSV